LFYGSPEGEVGPDKGNKYFDILLRGNNASFEMDYDLDRDAFVKSAPPGIYKVVVDMEPQYTRANVIVRSGRTVKLLIDPFEVESKNCNKKGFIVLLDGSLEKKYPSILYQSFLVNPPNTMVVKYCQKRVRGGKTYFRYAYMTYKNLAVYADEAILDRKTWVYRTSKRAKGRVVSDQRECTKTGKLAISLKIRRQSDFICSNLEVRYRPNR
jgi:hypothetical protein